MKEVIPAMVRVTDEAGSNCDSWVNLQDQFLARDSMLSALYAIANSSVARVDQSKMVKVRIMQLSPSPSLSCLRYKFHPEIPTGSPRAGASNNGGSGKRANSVF